MCLENSFFPCVSGFSVHLEGKLLIRWLLFYNQKLLVIAMVLLLLVADEQAPHLLSYQSAHQHTAIKKN